LRVQIGDRKVGGGEACFIVAEMGINHNGQIEIAKEMIDKAVKCGVDAVKFQAFKTEEFVSDKKQIYVYKARGKEITESMYEMFKRCEFSAEDFKELFGYCKQKKILCFATPQNVSDLEMLLRIGIPAIKVGSDDLTNLPLLRSYAAHRLPMIISTGMATLGEIEEGINTIKLTGNKKLVVLHCTSSYPPFPEEINLNKIRSIHQAFPVIVGFSDHARGIIASLGAIMLGAKVLEKHFTLDRNMIGPDHWFSADPKELKELVQGVRILEKMMGSPVIGPTPREKQERKIARRSIVATRDIGKGEKIVYKIIVYKRPGTGLLPKFTDLVIGRKANCIIKTGELITLEKLE